MSRLRSSDDLAKQGELGAAELFGPLAVSASGEDHSEIEFGNNEQALPAVPNARRPGEIATVVRHVPVPPVVAVEKRPLANGDGWLHGRGDPGGGHDLALLPCTPGQEQLAEPQQIRRRETQAP